MNSWIGEEGMEYIVKEETMIDKVKQKLKGN